MTYNFDEIIHRENTDCEKYDRREKVFGNANVLPMWVADMDFRTPDFIIDAIHERGEHEVLGYTFRNDSYYEAIAGWMKRRHNWDISRKWISFSPGVVSGITMSILSFTSPGDKIIVQPPVYFPFFTCIKGTDREMVENPLILENGRYRFDLDDLKKKIDSKTKMLILCNPHNPAGMVWKKEELEALGKICIENNILLVSDEIHSDLIYSGNKHIPAASVSKKMEQNTIVCMAPSKTFNVAGLSTSVIIIPNDTLRRKYSKILDILHVSLGNIFGNVALEAAYSKGDEWLSQLMKYIEGNYNYLKTFFSEQIPSIKVIQPEATYLVWLDCSKLGMTDEELINFFTHEAKVGLSDGLRFGTGGSGFMRLNIGCPRSILVEGLNRIAEALNHRSK
ncbi:MAG: PatB family C-S lyase [Bacteroidota bacterium]|nr:PatB family C-S lyase [Bacteroidota bacterium]MDP4205690.1 PatB family C-S lyase [Bacteroidota bacterium]